LRTLSCHKGGVDKARCGSRMEREREGKGRQIQSDHKGFEEIGCRDKIGDHGRKGGLVLVEV